MRVLITRPEEDAVRFAELLRARGHQPLCASLLAVRFFDGPELDLANISAVLATSANGVRAFARRTDRRDLKVLSVGPQTAEEARKSGFADVACADGDAVALARAVTGWVKPQDGVLLHAAGAANEGQLKTLLEQAGFAVEVMALYEVTAVRELPAPAHEALAANALDATVVFSPRSAKILRACIERAQLTQACRNIAAICISQAAAEKLDPLVFRRVIVAAKPNQDAMLAAIAGIAGEREKG